MSEAIVSEERARTSFRTRTVPSGGAVPAIARTGRMVSSSSTAGWLGALERTSRIGSDPTRILPGVIEEVAARYAERPALIGEDATLTYGSLAGRMNAYSRWALREGAAAGRTTALLMPNGPDYLAAWLGITRVGGVVALLNTNLRGPALAHCIDIARPRAAIVAAELEGAFASAEPHLASRPMLWRHGAGGGGCSLDAALADLPDGPLGSDETRPVTQSDRALLIYTSGTTGLPKAAHVGHHRLMSWSHWFAGLLDIGPDDRIYDPLPLYHSVGGVVAPASLLVSGGSVVVRRRFSASGAWPDIVGTGCTLVQYIGELCRYLMNAPPHPLERAHRLRAVTGNGLRPDVWEAFQSRFAIPRVLEFYAATEGTLSLYNVEGKVGAVGRIPGFMAHRSPAAIVRHDPDLGRPGRDPDGRCIRVDRGEAGELIARLKQEAAGADRFEGYTDDAEGERKILRDVFAPGDSWLRTGDLMRQDEAGFFYFVDRVGDTFRWKGENVATTEVAEVLGRAAGIAEAAVYGVAVPGAEGRAGMAALDVTAEFDLGEFARDVATALPTYARPVFLRFTGPIAATETFKQRKAALAEEGFDPTRIADPLFVLEPGAGRYVPLDVATFRQIAAGRMRL